MNIEAAGYVGRQHKNGFVGYDADVNSFVLLEFAEGAPELAEELFLQVRNQEPDPIVSGSLQIDELIKKLLNDTGIGNPTALVAGAYIQSTFYLCCLGTGSVFMRRNEETIRLLAAEHTAVGIPETQDMFIFVNDVFLNAIGGEGKIASLLGQNDLASSTSAIAGLINEHHLTGAVALIIRFIPTVETRKPVQEIVQNPIKKHEPPAIKEKPAILISTRKKIVFIGVIIIFVILLWSVVFGMGRRKRDRAVLRIAQVRSEIEAALNSAADSAFLDPGKARDDVESAEQKVIQIKEEVADTAPVEYAELVAYLKSREAEITHVETAETTEFFDVSVDHENAIGKGMALSGDDLLILDTAADSVYVLSLEKKSLETITNDRIGDATLMAGNGKERVFYVPSSGVFSLNNDKPDPLITFDPQWGSITALSMFNSNIYLLDKGQNQLFRYVPVESGYSSAQPYFTENTLSLTEDPSLAIDGSVFIGYENVVLKYTGGVRNDFSPLSVASGLAIEGIYTSSEEEHCYLWDKKNGALWVLGKDGSYIKEIRSDTLKKAVDIAVYQSTVYLLEGSKIFALPTR